MMLEIKDPAIRLFGKKIPFPAAEEEMEKSGRLGDREEGEAEISVEKGTPTDNPSEAAEQETPESPENKNSNENSWQNSKSEAGEEDETSKDQSDSSNSQENQQTTTTKPLKKPSKILPCPRCNSMDTKFCYYNNYNINQPRHFCKACQRYWTAGGTMRNVPVGAGRRKNKNSSSHYRHITISEALQAARFDSTLKTNGRVLSFGVEAQNGPICDSMASVLKLAEQKVLSNCKVVNGARNGLHSFGDHRVVARMENGDDCSSGSSVTASYNHSMDESRNMNGGYGCIPSVPWPYTWNPAIPPPGFYPPPGFPMPFYPYWSYPVLSPQSSSSSHKGSSSPGSDSPTLGKHSRDEETPKQDAPKQRNLCVLVPKTLRFDDPNEAAKSSIWTTLGIKNEGMFKGFDQKEKKTKKNGETTGACPVLHANPAALSRSIDFHERM